MMLLQYVYDDLQIFLTYAMLEQNTQKIGA